MRIVKNLSFQSNFSCLVVGFTPDICLLQFHVNSRVSEFRPVLLSFESAEKIIVNQIWKVERQFGLFFDNTLEVLSGGKVFSTSFNTSFPKALTLITERFSKSGQRITLRKHH